MILGVVKFFLLPEAKSYSRKRLKTVICSVRIGNGKDSS